MWKYFPVHCSISEISLLLLKIIRLRPLVLMLRVIMSMEHWWNDTVRGKPQLASENMSLYFFFPHKPQVELPQIKLVPPP